MKRYSKGQVVSALAMKAYGKVEVYLHFPICLQPIYYCTHHIGKWLEIRAVCTLG
jgi:uncharacterized protein (DUF2062 family)